MEKSTIFQKLTFEIEINVSAQKTYEIMIGKETYKNWTKIFNPTSDFKGSWEKGSKILFVGISEDGQEGGMVSQIADNIRGEFISIKHIGILHGGEEITSGPMVEGWGDALENYYFEPQGENNCKLKVTMDVNEEYLDYFTESWPKALEALKNLAEG
ncbi:MAG: SRPBCC domain-containing protein [Cytophagaceae bacterium]|nr:SRPBCC domain-containing protein [Cytophagaceae bacterium]MBL0302902.1 SRPBCC domain-containing protein [Cytophagaceae bacterium]MBL0325732.1 SRPBCC domain-containing protein [Cytophagaceae bacterium]